MGMFGLGWGGGQILMFGLGWGGGQILFGSFLSISFNFTHGCQCLLFYLVGWLLLFHVTMIYFFIKKILLLLIFCTATHGTLKCVNVWTCFLFIFQRQVACWLEGIVCGLIQSFPWSERVKSLYTHSFMLLNRGDLFLVISADLSSVPTNLHNLCTQCRN